jgi:hypothetical protein
MNRNDAGGSGARLRTGRWLLLCTLAVSGGACGGQAEAPEAAGQAGAPSSQPSACVSEVAMEGGLQRCANGLIHRAAQGTCANPPPVESLPSEWLAEPEAGAYPYMYPCRRNADCADKPFGRCVLGRAGPACVYACATDDDCNVNELCLCEATGGVCTQATCRTDAVCGEGKLCAGHTACDVTQFLCQTGVDECAVDADCSMGQPCQLADFNEINPLVSPSYYYRVCRSTPCAR